jgi:putative restriction endonuclease
LDAAFDAGLIFILANGAVGVSSALPPHAMAVLKVDTRITLSLSPRHEAYLAWHRDHAFRR